MSHSNLTTLVKLLAIAWLAIIFTGCETTPQKSTADSDVRGGIATLAAQDQARYKKLTARMQAGDYTNAEAGLTQLQAAYPEVNEIPLNIAISQFHNGQLQAAKATLTPLLNAGNAAAYANNLAGLIAQQDGNFKAAQKYYEVAVEKKPDYANALYNLALLHDVYLQDVAAAVPYYQRYVKLVPEDENTKGWTEQLTSSLAY